MTRELLAVATIQSSFLFLAIWGIFRLIPSIPANSKAWIWRLAFLKPLLSLLPFAVITLRVLPASAPVVSMETPIISQSPGLSAVSSEVSQVVTPTVEPGDPVVSLWFVGTLLVGGYGIYGWCRAKTIARRAEPVSNPQILEALSELMERAKVVPPIRILCSASVQSAMLLGGLRSTIVLPSHVLEHESFHDVRLMLAHEVAHISRRDLAWFGLSSAVQSLYFFNPVVWLAARCSRLDHESATDRYASQLAGVPIQTYAEMLLRATVVARTSLAPGTLPMAESYRTIHRRLEAMKHFNMKPTLWRKSAIAALAMATLSLIPGYQLAHAAAAFPQYVPPPPVISDQKGSDRLPSPPLEPARRTYSIDSKKGVIITKIWKNGKFVVEKTTPLKSVKLPKFQEFFWNGAKYIQVPTSAPTTLTPSLKVPDQAPPAAPAKVIDQVDVGPVAGDPSRPVKVADAPPAQASVDVGPNAEDPRVAEDQKISLKLEGEDARATVRVLFKRKGAAYVMDGSFQGKVTLEMENVSFETALFAIVKAVGGICRYEQGTYHLSGEGQPTRSVDTRAKEGDTITAQFDNADVREAIRNIFKNTGTSFNIDPKIQGVVTCQFKNVSLENVLRNILAQVNGTYRVEGGVYTILPKD